jgi:hypothetical protein
MDVDYINLLDHLQSGSTNVSNEQLASSISYYLYCPSSHTPSPTGLVAAVVRSARWKPYTFASCTCLRDAFMHAAILKHYNVSKEEAGIFSPSRSATLDSWLLDVCRGTEGGPSLLRLACLAGLSKGIDESQKKTPSLRLRRRKRIEDGIVAILSETLQTRLHQKHSWTEELRGQEGPYGSLKF